MLHASLCSIEDALDLQRSCQINQQSTLRKQRDVFPLEVSYDLQGRDKISFIQSMLKEGLQPFFSDLDVTWLQDPFPLARQHPEAAVLISTDIMSPTEMGGDLEECPVTGDAPLGMLNVGIHLMRPAALPILQVQLSGSVTSFWQKA